MAEPCPGCGRPQERPLGPWGRARARMNLSTRNAGALAKVSASTVSRADYDGDALTFAAAARLAKVYGVSLDEMAEG